MLTNQIKKPNQNSNNPNRFDFNELLQLLQAGDESNYIEAKSAAEGLGRSFIETVCAFSNEPDLGGGYILLGVTANEQPAEEPYRVFWHKRS